MSGKSGKGDCNVGEVPICPICNEDLNPIDGGKTNLLATSCGHLFHDDCLRGKDRRVPHKCPMCKEKLRHRADSVYPDYKEHEAVSPSMRQVSKTPTLQLRSFGGNSLGLPPLVPVPPASMPFEAHANKKTPQNVTCRHADCAENLTLNNLLVQDYNTLTADFKRLQNENAKEDALIRKLRIITSASVREIKGINERTRQLLKRKRSDRTRQDQNDDVEKVEDDEDEEEVESEEDVEEVKDEEDEEDDWE